MTRQSYLDDISLVQPAMNAVFVHLADSLAFAIHRKAEEAQELPASAAYEIDKLYHVFTHESSPH